MSKKNLKKVILSDVDGVLLDWEHAFHTWMDTKGHTRIADFKCMYSLEKIYDLEDEHLKELVAQFNSSAAIGFLPPLRDSMHYVKELHEKHGFIFHAITSMGEDESAHKLRIMNIKKLFGETSFEEFRFLPVHALKYPILAEYKEKGFEGYWIEDRVDNALYGASLGFKSLVVEHGHNMNRKSDKYQLVKTWKQIHDIISKDVDDNYGH